MKHCILDHIMKTFFFQIQVFVSISFSFFWKFRSFFKFRSFSSYIALGIFLVNLEEPSSVRGFSLYLVTPVPCEDVFLMSSFIPRIKR